MSEEKIIPKIATTLREQLRAVTPARVGLGRAGDGISTRDWMDFKLAHAEARDAVHAELQIVPLMQALREMRFGTNNVDCVALGTKASDRASYLRRPDWGRRLNAESAELLKSKTQGEVAIMIADGLSALAVERHAVVLMKELLPKLSEMKLKLATFSVVARGRVAVGDEIGSLLGAKFCITLIGERPGLSAPDSLGVYLTWGPHVGCTDAERNCISNIRHEGLSYKDAAARIAWLTAAAFRLGMTGVAIKENAADQLR